MTLKDMMLGSAIAALVTGGAIAQTAETPAPEPDTSTVAPEAPMAQTESTTGSGDAPDISPDTTMESDTTTESPVAPDATTPDAPAKPDTGAAGAPEGGAQRHRETPTR